MLCTPHVKPQPEHCPSGRADVGTEADGGKQKCQLGKAPPQES